MGLVFGLGGGAGGLKLFGRLRLLVADSPTSDEVDEDRLLGPNRVGLGQTVKAHQCLDQRGHVAQIDHVRPV